MREPLQVHHMESIAAFSEIGATINIISELPIGFEALYNKEFGLGKLDNLDEVIAAFDKAIEINPQD